MSEGITLHICVLPGRAIITCGKRRVEVAAEDGELLTQEIRRGIPDLVAAARCEMEAVNETR